MICMSQRHSDMDALNEAEHLPHAHPNVLGV